MLSKGKRAKPYDMCRSLLQSKA